MVSEVRLTVNTTQISKAIMFRFFLLTVVLATAKASYFSGGHGLSVQPKFLSQSVHLQEIPTKIIRITKTVAVKVPVPYPVKHTDLPVPTYPVSPPVYSNPFGFPQVPQHIPVPVPVNHPVAVPVPQIVKVPHHIPIEISKPVPYELQQQVPLLVSKPVPFPQPVAVPHPVAINKPVLYPVPHAVPYPQHSESTGYEQGGYSGGNDEGAGHGEQSYNSYIVESQGNDYDQGGHNSNYGNENFHGSQPDYSAQH